MVFITLLFITNRIKHLKITISITIKTSVYISCSFMKKIKNW